jgi:hypothetical protein
MMLQEQRRIGFGGPIEARARANALSTAVDHTVFLDEPPGPSAPLRVQDTASAVETFPDEDYGKDPAARAKHDRSPIRLFEVKRLAAGEAGSDEQAGVGRIRPGMLLLFFVTAAFAAFGIVRAYQVSGLSSVTPWQLIGR